MKKNILLLFLAYVILSCNKEQPNTTTSDQEIINSSQNITAKDIEDLDYIEYVLSDTSSKVISSWVQFEQLSIHIENLKKAKLNFFSEDQNILKNFMIEMKSEIPELLNTNAINARLLALETSSYKLHDEAVFNQNNKNKLLEAIGDVLKAKSSLDFQINKKFEKEAQKIQKPL